MTADTAMRYYVAGLLAAASRDRLFAQEMDRRLSRPRPEQGGMVLSLCYLTGLRDMTHHLGGSHADRQ